MTESATPSSTGPILLATRADLDTGPVARTAADLARAMDRELVVLYVAEELATAPFVAAHTGVDEKAMEEEILDQVEARVRTFVADHLGDLHVRVKIDEGNIVDRIVEHAQDEGAALVIIGHHEQGILGRLFEGDPARELLDHTPCPVVVVPLQ